MARFNLSDCSFQVERLLGSMVNKFVFWVREMLPVMGLRACHRSWALCHGSHVSVIALLSLCNPHSIA